MVAAVVTRLPQNVDAQQGRRAWVFERRQSGQSIAEQQQVAGGRHSSEDAPPRGWASASLPWPCGAPALRPILCCLFVLARVPALRRLKRQPSHAGGGGAALPWAGRAAFAALSPAKPKHLHQLIQLAFSQRRLRRGGRRQVLLLLRLRGPNAGAAAGAAVGRRRLHGGKRCRKAGAAKMLLLLLGLLPLLMGVCCYRCCCPSCCCRKASREAAAIAPTSCSRNDWRSGPAICRRRWLLLLLPGFGHCGRSLRRLPRVGYCRRWRC